MVESPALRNIKRSDVAIDFLILVLPGQFRWGKRVNVAGAEPVLFGLGGIDGTLHRKLEERRDRKRADRHRVEFIDEEVKPAAMFTSTWQKKHFSV